MSSSNALRVPAFFSRTGASTGLLVSGLLHALLLVIIIVGWVPAEKPRETVKPRYIEAKLLQMKPAVAQAAKPKPQPKPQPKPEPKVDEAAIKKAEEQKRQEQLKQEQLKQEQLKKEQQAKAEAERRRQEALKKEQQAKAEAEKKRQEELKKAEQAKAEAERKRQEELRRQQELAKALALEDEMLEDAEAEAQVGTYIDYMASLIASNWSRPPSARRGMVVELEIFLGAAGRVTGVRTIKSSGNAAFDLSAEQAVKKVGQFSRLREVDPGIYQRDFRKIRIVFDPQDLRM
jgi:colicin import membrane protein